MTNTLDESITAADFIELSRTAKIDLIDRLAATLITIGEEYADIANQYYSQKYGDKLQNFAEVAGRKAALEIRYDVQKHLISSLQSTLKAERMQ